MGELDGVTADLRWIRKNMESHDTILAEIFERLRKIENDVAAIEAKQKPPISGWTVFGIIATVAVSILIILDRIYVNQ
jgi:hypothetical protein